MFNYNFNYNTSKVYKKKYTNDQVNSNDIFYWESNSINTIEKNFINININNLKIYCLTIDKNIERRENIYNNFKDISINFIYTSKTNDISKFQSGAIGISKIIDIAISKFENNNIFEPFIIIEDDIKKTSNFINNINIPYDSDLVYLGISKFGIIDKNNGIKGYIYGDNVCNKKSCFNNDISNCISDISNCISNVIKIKNMLSTHAILINSFKGVLIYQKAMIDAMINNRHYDIPLAIQQQYYNIYALRKPIFCQDILHGGQEDTDYIITDKMYKSNIAKLHLNYILKNNVILNIYNL
jgi:hypothetical protein